MKNDDKPVFPPGREGGNGRKIYDAPRVMARERLEAVANVCTGTPDAKSPGGVGPGGACGAITGITSS